MNDGKTTSEIVVRPIREPSNVQHVQLCATDASAMALSQEAMVEFFTGRMREAEREVDEAERNLKIAEEAGFQLRAFKRHLTESRRLVRFHEKCSVVVHAGHALVPNFPVDVFAIRTDRDSPRSEKSHSWRTRFTQTAPGLPYGEGDYVDSVPLEDTRNDPYWKKDEKGEFISNWVRVVTDFQQVNFPESVRQSDVMTAVHSAMKLQAFDDFGVLPERKAKGDPIVIGRVKDPRRARSHRPLCFMVAWYIDTRTI